MTAILTLLDEEPLRLLRSTAPCSWTVCTAADLSQVVEHCSSTAFDVFVSGAHNLGKDTDGILDTIVQLDRAFAPPLVLFVKTPVGELDTAVRLAARGAQFQLAIWGPHGDHEGLPSAVTTAVASGFARALVDPLLAQLPEPTGSIGTMLVDLFQRPGRFDDTTVIASRMNLTLQAINHMLRRCQLGSFTKLRRAARVAQCYRLMKRAKLTSLAAARFVGYGSQDSFSRDVKTIAGVPCAKLPKLFTDEEIVALSTTYCRIAIVDSAR